MRADVIVALGGDDGQRVSKVAEVFRAGYAGTVLITGLEGSPERERAYYLNWRVKVLADAGVAADRIVVESTASNSFQEARATLALMQGRGWVLAGQYREQARSYRCGERCLRDQASPMCWSPASPRGGMRSTGGRARSRRSSC